MRRASLVLLLLAPVLALATWVNKAGETLPDTDSRKSVGEFGAQMLLMADDREMFRVWGIPSETVNLKTIDSVAVGEQINAFIVFSGCKPSSTGLCDVTVRFRVYQPNGKIYADAPPMEIWQSKKPPAQRMLELGVQYLKIVIEPQDLLGKYIVTAQVRDNQSGATLALWAPFTAIKSR
jgi:hypothetical protein